MEAIDKILLSDCIIKQQPHNVVIAGYPDRLCNRVEIWFKDKCVYAENVIPEYPHLERAMTYMDIQKPEKWKTLGRLKTFRQALRENLVNAWGIDEMLEFPLTHDNYKAFINEARIFDRQHHGSRTF